MAHRRYTLRGMTGITHLYMTLHGAYKSGPFLGEQAQIGLRLYPMAYAGGTFGAYLDMTREFDATEVFDSTSSGSWTVTQNWAAHSTTGPAATIGLSQQVALADQFWTFAGAIKQYQSTAFNWTHVKIAPIYPGTKPASGPTPGKYAAPASVLTHTAPIAGTGTGSMPPQDAVCVSLRTPVVGRRGRGRMYLPALASAVNVDGQVSATPRSTFANAAKALVLGIEGLIFGNDGGYRVIVTSAGETRAVIPREIRVGDEWDTHRSREEQRAEVYTTLSI